MWENTNVAHFSCYMGKYSTYVQWITYSLNKCCIFLYRTRMNTVRISYFSLIWRWNYCRPSRIQWQYFLITYFFLCPFLNWTISITWHFSLTIPPILLALNKIKKTKSLGGGGVSNSHPPGVWYTCTNRVKNNKLFISKIKKNHVL